MLKGGGESSELGESPPFHSRQLPKSTLTTSGNIHLSLGLS